MTLHLDEKTPHFHFHLKNFDEQGYSIFRKIKTKKNLSNLQDITYENFKNMDMKRGIKKDTSNKDFDYKSIKQYYEEGSKKIREEITELRKFHKEEKQKLRDQKNNITKDNRYKKDEKIEKHKFLNLDIKNIQQKEKKDINSLKSKLENLKKIETDNKKIKIDIKKNTKKKEVNNEFRIR